MSGRNRFGVRLKPDEEKLLISLADHLERNVSDTLRFAIRNVAREYGLLPSKPPAKARQHNQNKKGGDKHAPSDNSA